MPCLKVRNPDMYSVDKKPAEVSIYQNGPRTRTPGAMQNALTHGQPAAPMAMTASFPYGYYPPPFPPMPPWYPQPPNPALPMAVQPIPTQPAPGAKIDYPKIPAWLKHCDNHPDRGDERFFMHAWKFEQEGYRRINQLTGERTTVEKLSQWLDIGKGTADLLIQYAEEDVALVKAGTFLMILGDGSDAEEGQNDTQS